MQLKENNVAFDEVLVVQGDFHEVSAAKAVDELMVGRNMKPQAIVVVIIF